MRWRSGRRSSNVEDRRGRKGGAKKGFQLGLIGTIAIILVGWMLGADPIRLLSMMGGTEALLGTISSSNSSAPPNDAQGEFVSRVLGNTEDVWNPIFKQLGGRYQEPKLVLFEDSTSSACGYSSAATGPFYCPGDSKVYIDLGFFRELEGLGAPGDFARAYVLGHEVGHHVQNLFGITEEVSRLQARSSQRDSNALSVALELQADCYAGVWANHSGRMNMLEAGDIEEAMQAAAAIGDDRLQRMAGQRINPDAFTHGSSQQRMEWFQRGLKSGDPRDCDSFKQM